MPERISEQAPPQSRHEPRPAENPQAATRPEDGRQGRQGDGRANPTGRSFWFNPAVILIGAAIFGVVVFLGARYLVHSAAHESTDDAFLDAHVVGIAPKIAGLVSAVHVTENQFVTNGQLLIEIDARDFEARAAKQKAAVASAEANRRTYEASFELVRRRVETAQAAARQTQAEAEAARATAERAVSDFKRVQELRGQNIASAQEFDIAKSAAEAANANLTAAQAKAAADASRLAESESQVEAARNLLETARANAAQSAAELRSAELELSYTRVVAPGAGRVTRKSVEPGSFTQIGQRLFALVPTNVWVIANFKETQLGKMRVGQRADVKIDAYPGHRFAAHVESIQAGSGARFSLLPPENAVGNFVKVVQRVPVKIVFDQPVDGPNPLGPGMSVEPDVTVQRPIISESAIVLIAVASAIVMAAIWWLLARRKNV